MMFRLLLYVALSFGIALCQNDVEVNTEYGSVAGSTRSVNNGREVRDVVSFLGIPFAADTSGDNRFKKPSPPAPWDTVLSADTVGDACPQGPGGLLSLTHANWTRYSENCLHLNIYTPSVAGSNAVMVWFFGGGYQSGANFQYPGNFLATRDVVVVTVNYRLGALGFGYTGDDASPGNMGMWDQNMAIQFVKNNIANFGGDPERITLFGESAGAGSTALHVLSPHSKDLFQQAILQSGAETNFWVTNPPETHPENYINQTAESLGCDTSDSFAMIACMRELSWENIVENGTFDCEPGYICMGMSPVVDNPTTGFLPDTPANLRETGNIMTGPILAGINYDDASVFLPVFVPEVILGCCNRTYYRLLIDRRITEILAPFVDEETHDQLVEAIDFYYAPWPYVFNNYINRDSLIKLVTDAIFGLPWNRLVTAQAQLADTYGYIYNYRSRNFTNFLPEWFGVPHIAEIPYVWGLPLLSFNEAVQEESEINVELIDWTDEDVQHTIFLQDLFTNFAKHGNPTPEPVDNPLGSTTDWPRVTVNNKKALVIGNTSIEAQEFRQRDYVFWDDYADYLMSGSPVFEYYEKGLPSDWLMSFVNYVSSGKGQSYESTLMSIAGLYEDDQFLRNKNYPQ